MENRIKEHQKTQDLRGQVLELMENALNFGRAVEKMRDMIACLLREHEGGSTDKFRSDKVHNNSLAKIKQDGE